jgi:anthranilate phosphoribosyltransferase
MSYTQFIKEIGRGTHASRDLPEAEALRLFGAMLDGGVPELELGAIILALRMKTEAVSELVGFYQAMQARVNRLALPTSGLRPVVLPTYNGARRQANLTPLLALLLKRLGVPVLMHGTLESEGRVATSYVLRELGIMPCASLGAAEQAMESGNLAFVPIGLLSPGLADLLALRNRLGVRNSAHTLAKLVEPFAPSPDMAGGSLRMVSITHPAYADKLRDLFVRLAEVTGETAHMLLMRGTEGEAFANPKRRPQIDRLHEGQWHTLFDAEGGSIKSLPQLPEDCDARTTAQWIRETLDGRHPVPLPILNQAACCLYASGYSNDFAEAKAIVAVKSHSLAMAA